MPHVILATCVFTLLRYQPNTIIRNILWTVYSYTHSHGTCIIYIISQKQKRKCSSTGRGLHDACIITTFGLWVMTTPHTTGTKLISDFWEELVTNVENALSVIDSGSVINNLGKDSQHADIGPSGHVTTALVRQTSYLLGCYPISVPPTMQWSGSHQRRFTVPYNVHAVTNNVPLQSPLKCCETTTVRHHSTTSDRLYR